MTVAQFMRDVLKRAIDAPPRQPRDK